ncbi:hypothetical protein Tco_0451035 [Tanacetum coccineum]
MLDPFLAMDEDELVHVSKYVHQKPFMNDDIEIEKLNLNGYAPRTNMSIAGKLNPDDGTITLLVQTADAEGTDNAKITRKRSKPDKHEHGNGKSAQETEVSSKVNLGQPTKC